MPEDLHLQQQIPSRRGVVLQNSLEKIISKTLIPIYNSKLDNWFTKTSLQDHIFLVKRTIFRDESVSVFFLIDYALLRAHIIVI